MVLVIHEGAGLPRRLTTYLAALSLVDILI
jgi:hypothetical protein